MSRTLPIDSPLGPNTGSPASWATKTLLLWRHEDQVRARGAQLNAGGVRVRTASRGGGRSQ